MEFAICQWDAEILRETIDSLHTDGVTALEPGPSFLLTEDKATFKEDIQRLRAVGIRIYSCHAPFVGPHDLSLSKEDGQSQAIESHIKALERAALAGAGCLVVHPCGVPQNGEEEIRLIQLYNSLETLIPKAEELGVPIALENMPPKHLVGTTSASLMAIVDRFDSPFLGVCFDTGHAHLNKEHVVDALNILRPRIINFHIHDNEGELDSHLQPPSGTIDWEAFAPLLREMEVSHPISIEAPPPSGSSWRDQLDAMQSLFAGC